jgi:hypothetical protein
VYLRRDIPVTCARVTPTIYGTYTSYTGGFSGTVGSGRPLGQEAKKRNDFYVRAYVRRKEDGADAGWGKMAREQPFVVSKALAASLASIIPA